MPIDETMPPIARGQDQREALRARIAWERDVLGFPRPPWVHPRSTPDGAPVLDCAIIGAGQSGLTVAAGLLRERVDRIAIFDSCPVGQEGPWRRNARMAMLRTPKDLTGPDLGMPSLSFRAWWEAQHGAEGWRDLFRIPRESWADYLDWFRGTLDVPVHNLWALRHVTPISDSLLHLAFSTPEGPRSIHARCLALCTGADGSGGYVVPDMIRRILPTHLYAHANDPIDFTALRGKRIGIIGGGATGFDTAIAALEAGAASAEICVRRAAMPRQNPRRWMENAGFLAHYADLPDAERWRYMQKLYAIGQPPPLPTWQRAQALAGFSLRLNTPWEQVGSADGTHVEARGGGTVRRYDFVIAATGLVVDMAMRPEFAALLSDIQLWEDVYTPPVELADVRLGRFPYLDRYGALSARNPAASATLGRIFVLSRGATLSLGPVAASNSGLKYAAPRLIDGITRRLFLDQTEQTWGDFITGDHDEIGAMA